MTMGYFRCYYCEFTTDIDVTYQRHVEDNHPSMPVYPSTKQIKEYRLKPQNRIWENLGIE